MIDNKDWIGVIPLPGIIASMSYGSVGTPLNPGDQGDNGTSAEASLINQATDGESSAWLPLETMGAIVYLLQEVLMGPSRSVQ